MVTDTQQQQITDFCRKHHIIKFWLVDEAFDAPLPDQSETGNTPTAIVAFQQGKTPDFFTFLDMEEELKESTGPGTTLYTEVGFNQREMSLARELAVFHYAAPQ